MLQMVSTNALELLRFFRRNALNSSQDQGAIFLPWLRCLCWCQRKLIQPRSCKRRKVGPGGAGGIIVILTLMAEIVAFHIGLSIVDLREPSFQRPFSGAFWIYNTVLNYHSCIYCCNLVYYQKALAARIHIWVRDRIVLDLHNAFLNSSAAHGLRVTD